MVNHNKPVSCYWNLHKKQYSIRQSGKVINHRLNLTIRNAKFVVQPAGNRKVRETGRKNVHAFVKGHPCMFKMGRKLGVITYNPYKHTSFVFSDTEEPIYEAPYALLLTSVGPNRTNIPSLIAFDGIIYD